MFRQIRCFCVFFWDLGTFRITSLYYVLLKGDAERMGARSVYEYDMSMIQRVSGRNEPTMPPLVVSACVCFSLPALCFPHTVTQHHNNKGGGWSCWFCLGRRRVNQFFHHILNLKLMQACVCPCLHMHE